MSNDKNTGGQAFPQLQFGTFTDADDQIVVRHFQNPGMTLRDYFAAKAMVSFLNQWCVGDEIISDLSEQDYDCIANEAYIMADAMLKAREQ
jgi:hypothetical protein